MAVGGDSEENASPTDPDDSSNRTERRQRAQEHGEWQEGSGDSLQNCCRDVIVRPLREVRSHLIKARSLPRHPPGLAEAAPDSRVEASRFRMLKP